MALIEAQEAWEYVGFFEEPDEVTLAKIRRTIRTAEAYVKGAVGSYKEDDPRAKELGLMAFGFLYDNQTIEGKGSGALNAMQRSLLMQLRCEEVPDDENG